MGMLTSETLPPQGFPDPLLWALYFLPSASNCQLPPPHPGFSLFHLPNSGHVNHFTDSCPQQVSTAPPSEIGVGSGGGQTGKCVGGPRRGFVHKFLNVKCQLGVKSEPGDQLPGG